MFYFPATHKLLQVLIDVFCRNTFTRIWYYYSKGMLNPLFIGCSYHCYFGYLTAISWSVPLRRPAVPEVRGVAVVDDMVGESLPNHGDQITGLRQWGGNRNGTGAVLVEIIF